MALPVALVTGLVVWFVGGRNLGPVPVSATPTSAEATGLCRALSAELPARLQALRRRPIRGNSAAAAAWGDPPVTLRCGLAKPSSLARSTQTIDIDGVSWVPEPDLRSVTWTLTGRAIYVQVRVPARYDDQGPLLSYLSPVIRRTLPAR